MSVEKIMQIISNAKMQTRSLIDSIEHAYKNGDTYKSDCLNPLVYAYARLGAIEEIEREVEQETLLSHH